MKIVKMSGKDSPGGAFQLWLLDAIEQLVVFYSYLKTFNLEISSAE